MKKILYICDLCKACEEMADGAPTPDWYPSVWVKLGVEGHTLFEAAYNLCHSCRGKIVDTLRFGPAEEMVAADNPVPGGDCYEAAVQKRYQDMNRARPGPLMGRGHGG